MSMNQNDYNPEIFTIDETDTLISCASKEETIEVPKTVKCIGKSAFKYNKTIKKVVLNEELEEISEFALQAVPI